MHLYANVLSNIDKMDKFLENNKYQNYLKKAKPTEGFYICKKLNPQLQHPHQENYRYRWHPCSFFSEIWKDEIAPILPKCFQNFGEGTISSWLVPFNQHYYSDAETWWRHRKERKSQIHIPCGHDSKCLQELVDINLIDYENNATPQPTGFRPETIASAQHRRVHQCNPRN